MPFFRFGPFEDLEKMFGDDLNFSFPRFGGDLAADMFEEGDDLIVKMNVPGIDPEKVDISVEEDYLRVSGTREETQEEKKKDYFSREIRKGSFERAVRLPVAVKSDEARADYKDGVLTITIPKKEQQKGKKVNIEIQK